MPTIEYTRDALSRSEKAVTLRPSKGQYTHQTAAIIVEGTVCSVEEKHFQMKVDVPPSIGGGGAGPTPGALMRSALTSCVAIGVKLWAARANIAIDYVNASLEADVDARGELGVDDAIAPGFLDMRLKISVRSQAPIEAVESVIKQSLKYSSLFDVCSNAQDIKITLDIAGTEQMLEGGERSHA